MRYIAFIIIFASFNTYEIKSNPRMYLNETDVLLYEVQHRAINGTLDKQKIKDWLADYDRKYSLQQR